MRNVRKSAPIKENAMDVFLNPRVMRTISSATLMTFCIMFTIREYAMIFSNVRIAASAKLPRAQNGTARLNILRKRINPGSLKIPTEIVFERKNNAAPQIIPVKRTIINEMWNMNLILFGCFFAR